MDNKWRPTANLELIKLRAWLLKSIRDFFSQRDLLEVETPLLGQHTVSDPHLKSFKVGSVCDRGENLFSGFLQTSPEYFMKRLLAAEGVSIFQICKAFRDEEMGRHHNPEFTLLEWYRCDYDHQQLMLEVRELIEALFASKAKKLTWETFSYQQLFEKYLGINPHVVSRDALLEFCVSYVGLEQVQGLTKDDCLDLLLSHEIAPQLKNKGAVFVFDYPQSQAALAKLRKKSAGTADELVVASRFELYINGLEIANGYHELTDYQEQKKRFAHDNSLRQESGSNDVIADDKLLAALAAGLPECAGVAIGLDRLLMALSDAKTIAEVQAFAFDRV